MAPDVNAEFVAEALCDTQISVSGGATGPCPPGANYPRFSESKIHNGLHKLPPKRELKSMPHPCQGVPRNPWCRAPKKK